MRPLPRLHAVTDAAVIAADDFPVRAAAIAAAGPAVALHARDRSAGGAAKHIESGHGTGGATTSRWSRSAAASGGSSSVPMRLVASSTSTHQSAS